VTQACALNASSSNETLSASVLRGTEEDGAALTPLSPPEEEEDEEEEELLSVPFPPSPVELEDNTGSAHALPDVHPTAHAKGKAVDPEDCAVV
jgi:hypothetical protein